MVVAARLAGASEPWLHARFPPLFSATKSTQASRIFKEWQQPAQPAWAGRRASKEGAGDRAPAPLPPRSRGFLSSRSPRRLRRLRRLHRG